MASHHDDKYNNAIKEGAAAATAQQTVVIDKTGFAGLSDLERSQKVEASIRAQLPPEEADKYISTKIEAAKADIRAYGGDVADLLIERLEGQGYNLYNILVKPLSEGAYSSLQGEGGIEFCSVEHGELSGQVDDMVQNIAHATGADVKDIRKNFTAAPEEHAKRTGAHEGQHCDGTSGLHGEVYADKESYEHISPAAGLEYRDYRAITAMYDAGHATNPIVMGDQPTGSRSMDAKVGALHSGVSRVFDSVVEDYMGVDNESTHSSDWDMDKYAAATEAMKTDLINSANAMPNGPEKTEALIVAEATINYAEDYQDAYRRRVLGEDVPERKQVELVSKDDKTEFYKNHFDYDKYEKGNAKQLHSDIKENISKYGNADATAQTQDNDDWGWDEGPDDVGASLVAMGGDQNQPQVQEIERPQATIQAKPVEFSV